MMAANINSQGRAEHKQRLIGASDPACNRTGPALPGGKGMWEGVHRETVAGPRLASSSVLFFRCIEAEEEDDDDEQAEPIFLVCVLDFPA